MFKSARWRGEKNKFKVVFKLQFHATLVPQHVKDTLMVSLIPVEVGKPTVRLEKSTTIQDGTCRWDNPIYETVKFIQESKTGKISEKLYHFMVSTGSSKTGFLGEVSVNFADYFDAVKPSSVSLPFKASNSGAILHIKIQRVDGDVDQRETEENDIATVETQDRSLRSKFKDSETDENINCNSVEDISVRRAESQDSDSNSKLVVYKSSDGLSVSGSESSSERNTPRDIGLRNTVVRRGSGSFLSSLSNSSLPHKPATNSVVTNYLEHQRSNTEWSVGSAPDGSLDDSTNSSDDNPRATDTSVEKLKSNLVMLARQAEVSELEIQTLRKQIVKESRRGQDLSKEVIGLKEERDALREECEHLKASRTHNNDVKLSSKLQFESDDPYVLLQEIRQELNHEKDMNVNLRIQLQKTQESNSELILAVQDLEEMLELKNSGKPQDNVSKHEMSDDEEQNALELLVKEHDDAKENYLLEQKIIDLYSEIEVYRRDKDELEIQLEQLALDYEILKQENHDLFSKLEQTHLQEQLKAQYECSDSLVNMTELETQVESLENELHKQDDDLCSSLATIKELKSQVDSLENEHKEKEEDISTSLLTINKFKSQVECLENELQKKEEELATSLLAISKFRSQVENLENELQKKEEECSTSLTARNELRDQVENLEKELQKKEEECSTSLVTINELRSQVENLENELEKKDEECSTSLTARNEIRAQVENLEDLLLKKEEECSASLVTINKLKSQVENLENELEKKEEELSMSLVTVNELKSQVEFLEQELEKQAESFEVDLDAVMHAKVEQEQRAIRAEEALRKTRLTNASTAERLQEEFRRLSTQMSSTFDANEKLARKAVAEANELHLQKSHLEEMLEKASEDLSCIEDHYEEKLKDLSKEVYLAKQQAEQALLALEETSTKLEHQKEQDEEMRGALLKEILMRTNGMDNLSSQAAEKGKLQEERDELKASVAELLLLVQSGVVERNELEKNLASLRNEADKLLEELNSMRSLKDEKEKLVETLQSEVETLKADHVNLKNSLSEHDLEKEILRKQVFNLMGDIKKKEEMSVSNEKKLRDSSDETKASPKINKAVPVRSTKEVAGLQERIKLLQGQIRLKEASLEKSNSSFLQKEKDLHYKIEELESRMGQINDNSRCCCECQFQKEAERAETPKECSDKERGMDIANDLSDWSDKNGIVRPTKTSFSKLLISTTHDGDYKNFDELLSAMALMKEKNECMEFELKEIQERYSEISLKFAEVEGERQQLVMAVRNLKNVKKI